MANIASPTSETIQGFSLITPTGFEMRGSLPMRRLPKAGLDGGTDKVWIHDRQRVQATRLKHTTDHSQGPEHFVEVLACGPEGSIHRCVREF